MSRTIIGISLQERQQNAPKLQNVLTKYGCYIKTRIGLHNTSPDACGAGGIILLDFLEGSEEQIASFEKEMLALGKMSIQKMVF